MMAEARMANQMQQNDWKRSARLVLSPRSGLQVAYVMVDTTATTQIRKQSIATVLSWDFRESRRSDLSPSACLLATLFAASPSPVVFDAREL